MTPITSSSIEPFRCPFSLARLPPGYFFSSCTQNISPPPKRKQDFTRHTKGARNANIINRKKLMFGFESTNAAAASTGFLCRLRKHHRGHEGTKPRSSLFAPQRRRRRWRLGLGRPRRTRPPPGQAGGDPAQFERSKSALSSIGLLIELNADCVRFIYRLLPPTHARKHTNTAPSIHTQFEFPTLQETYLESILDSQCLCGGRSCCGHQAKATKNQVNIGLDWSSLANLSATESVESAESAAHYQQQQ